MFNSDTVPIPRKGFLLEELDGETLLYRHELKQMIYLSESAALVWKLCDGERTAQEIVKILSDAYPESGDIVAADVADALESLVREGALHLTRQPGKAAPSPSGGGAA